MAIKKQFPLRIDPDLWEEINRWAADELRSVNGQIEYVLRLAVLERSRSRVSQPSQKMGDTGD